MPVYPMSIRAPMRADGSAGEELADGAAGHVCFRGPQTFLGYVNNPEATARTISTDRPRDRLAGMAPPIGTGLPGSPAVPEYFRETSRVTSARWRIRWRRPRWWARLTTFSPRALWPSSSPGPDCSFMRPLHYVILEAGRMPLNRVEKTDYVRLEEMAVLEVERVRAQRRWDR